MTKQDKLIEILKAEGSEVVTACRSEKYVCMTRTRGEGFYWIGKSGALRVGNTVSSSIALPELAKRLLAGLRRTADADVIPPDMALRRTNSV